ncbi:hypothetical protein EDB84DRAFT_1579911 [Lactarius hengduanensis]|nr:hypothetical protein EDB84DRAFT_1579911 [Lactarius hengduanensis]
MSAIELFTTTSGTPAPAPSVPSLSIIGVDGDGTTCPRSSLLRLTTTTQAAMHPSPVQIANDSGDINGNGPLPHPPRQRQRHGCDGEHSAAHSSDGVGTTHHPAMRTPQAYDDGGPRKTPPPPADPVPVAAPVHQETYDTPHAPALPPEPEPKLWPAVPNDVIVPAPSPAPVPALAFKNISVSHLSSSPKLRHRAAMAAAHHPPEGGADTMFGSFGAIYAARTGPALGRAAPGRLGRCLGWLDVGVAEVEDSEEEDDGGMLVDTKRLGPMR